MAKSLEQRFGDVYTKFKVEFYRNIFSRFEEREASLTTVETFCIEIIHVLHEPTINEFAQFVRISKPNATYKINSLVKKGYVEKIQSKEDKREFNLRVTPKFYEYYNLSNSYIDIVAQRMRERFSAAEVENIEQILSIIAEELMPEVPMLEQ